MFSLYGGFFNDEPPPRRGYKRHLQESDVESWEKAANQRPAPRTREQVIERIRLANPVRWRRMQRDYRWMQRQMKKMGLNPDDARELL